jgi:hypothetical protein
MSAKPIKIDSLDLDLENPRIKQAADQREAMQNLISLESLVRRGGLVLRPRIENT